MELRADFSRREVVRPEDEAWRASPMPGVDRRMLDRIGDEVARATTIVRYAPNSSFSAHAHDGGEEFLVLEGTFADEHGRYSKGTYVRNPVGTSHTPEVGADGCTILVKLHQFSPEDQTRTVIDSEAAQWYLGTVPGLSVLPLHQFGTESVALVRWAPNTQFNGHRHWGGEEILLLDGVFNDEHGSYPAGTWIRSPHMSEHTPFTGPEGALIYVKTGHLAAD
ncbi:MAG: cupin domain-containing protein [Roseibium sp.]|nr:cupin domain-containing protein [Roseibium sp.]